MVLAAKRWSSLRVRTLAGESEVKAISAPENTADNINNINIIGELEIIKDFKKPATLLPTFYNWVAHNIIFRLIAKSKLKVIGEFCQGCRVCADNCPVGAITMKEIPVIDYKKCIFCHNK